MPNTLLKKDIIDVTAQPTYKVFAVISKHYTDDKYTQIGKLDKLSVNYFTQEGSNMPDISLLIHIAEYFDISIPEIINGERKSGNMREEVREA